MSEAETVAYDRVASIVVRALDRADRVTESRRAQGLPDRVEDPSVLRRVAGLFESAGGGFRDKPPRSTYGPAPAKRPARRMPTLAKVAQWHRLPAQPACVRCGWESWKDTWEAKGTGLERAHIIDRAGDHGLDHEANLAPLCRKCHAEQPIFKPGRESDALAWFGLTGFGGGQDGE